jgi:hypothetical protein
MIDLRAFQDELIKIAVAEQPGVANHADLKQFLANTGLITAGAVTGYGAGHLARKGLTSFAPDLSPDAQKALLLGATIAGGVGFKALGRRIQAEKRRRTEEARQQSLKEDGSGR